MWVSFRCKFLVEVGQFCTHLNKELLNAQGLNQRELSSWQNPLIISLDFKGCPDKENLNGSAGHYLIYAVCIIPG